MSGRCGGWCCEQFTFGKSPELLKKEAAGEYASDDLKNIADMVIPLFAIHLPNGGGTIWHYTCRHYDKTAKKCLNYEKRPRMCRIYPAGGRGYLNRNQERCGHSHGCDYRQEGD